MQPSLQYIKKIKEEEGFKAGPYRDTGGMVTIGYGMTRYPDGRRVTMKDMPITEPDAHSMLVTILKNVADTLNRLLINKAVVLNQNQFDSCLDFCYNAGTQAFANSTLFNRITTNVNDSDIYIQFNRWIHDAHGNVQPGLVTRCLWRANNYFAMVDKPAVV